MNAHTRTHAPAETHIPGELFELKSLLELDWPARQAAIAASGVPVNEETDEERQQREELERAAAEEARTAKTLSQAEVDRIVADRLARDRKDRPSDEEIKQLREKSAKYDELDEQNKTELQKMQARAEKAEQERESALTEAKDTRLRSAILAEAAKADRKVVDPESALALLDKSKLELDDDGNPKNIAEAMDALLEAKPFLVGGGTTTRGNADQGARGGADAQQLASVDGMSAEQIAEAVAEGRLDNYLASTT